MEFDDILKRVGDFGRYQQFVFLIVVILQFTAAWPAMITVFISASVDHWCKTPEWDTGCEQYGLSGDACELAQKEGSIPSNYTTDGELVYEQCEKYNVSEVEFWPGIEPSNYSSYTMKCDQGWNYDNSQYETTIVTDYDLVCGQGDLTQISQSVFYAGYLVGSIFFGVFSDLVGRWWSLVLANLISLVSGIALAFSPNWWVYTVIRFFQGFANIAFSIVLYVIGTEFIGPSRRNTSMLITISYAAGYMFIALPAYYIRYWRLLALVVTVPLAPLFIFFWWLPESARWLISTGKYDKAEELIKKVAMLNKATLPDPLFTKEFKEEQEIIRKQRKPTGLDLFRTPRMRIRTINLVFNWMVNAMVYHGLSLNSSNLGVNDYISFAISAGVEIPAYIMTAFIVEIIGRKLSLFATMMLGGVACICTAFIEPGAALTTVAMIGKFGISASFNIIYLYTVELNPTSIRGVAIGNCSMFSRVAGILAPLILTLSKYWDPLPLVIYGSLSVIAALFSLAFPETRGKKLPETLEEGERFGLTIKTELDIIDEKGHEMTTEGKDATSDSKHHYADMVHMNRHYDNATFSLQDEK